MRETGCAVVERGTDSRLELVTLATLYHVIGGVEYIANRRFDAITTRTITDCACLFNDTQKRLAAIWQSRTVF